MICECRKLKIGSFKTEKIYLDFKTKINQLVSDLVLKKLGEIDRNTPFFSYEYRCLICNTKWVLNTPDQAYRGGWFENQ